MTPINNAHGERGQIQLLPLNCPKTFFNDCSCANRLGTLPEARRMKQDIIDEQHHDTIMSTLFMQVWIGSSQLDLTHITHNAYLHLSRIASCWPSLWLTHQALLDLLWSHPLWGYQCLRGLCIKETKVLVRVIHIQNQQLFQEISNKCSRYAV